MDIFYQFDDDIRTAHVLVPWMIAKDLKPGTPLTETGEVANDDTAYGLLINAGDVGEGVVVKRNDLGGGITEVLPSQTVTTNDGDPASQPLSNNGDLNLADGTPAMFTLDVNGYRENVSFDSENNGWFGTTIALQVTTAGEVSNGLVFLFNDDVHDFYGDVTIAGYAEVDDSDIIPKQTARINGETPWTASLTGVNLDVSSPVPESFTLSINGETETLTCREWEFDSIKSYTWEGPHYSVEYSENWTLVALNPEGEEDITLPSPCVVSGYTGAGDSPLVAPLLCINCEVMIAGYCNEAAAEASCGLEYTDALKGALSDIVFADGKVSFGESGGGSEPTKTVYIPEQTVNLNEGGGIRYYFLENVTLNWNGTPPTFTLSVNDETDNMVYDAERQTWLGQKFRIVDMLGNFALSTIDETETLPETATISAYTIEESGGGGGVDYLPFGYSVDNMSSESGVIFPVIPYAREYGGVTYLAADLVTGAGTDGTPYLSSGDLAIPYTVQNLSSGTTPSLVAGSFLPPGVEDVVTIVEQSFNPSTQIGFALVHLEPITYEGNTFYWLTIEGHFETT